MTYTRRSAPVNSGVMGWVITVHFDQPIGGPKACPDHPPKPTQKPWHTIAGHWTGFAPKGRLIAVLAELEAGTHCRIIRAAKNAGISYRVESITDGDRNLERHLKRHGAGRRCSFCQQTRRQARREGGTPA